MNRNEVHTLIPKVFSIRVWRYAMISVLLSSESSLGWITDSICRAVISPTSHIIVPIDKGWRPLLELDEWEKEEFDDGRAECKSWIFIVSKKLRTFALKEIKQCSNNSQTQHQNFANQYTQWYTEEQINLT